MAILDRRMARVTTDEEIAWLVSQETLIAQRDLSLLQRTRKFELKFPTKRLSATKLRQIYSRYGIK